MLHWPVQAGKRITVWLINRSALYLIAPSNARTYASMRSYKFINNLHWKRHLPFFFACLLFICYLISVYSAISECERFYQLHDTAAKYSIDMCNTANMTDLSRDKAKAWNSKRGTRHARFWHITLIFFFKIVLSNVNRDTWLPRDVSDIDQSIHGGHTQSVWPYVCRSYEDQRKRI